VRKCTTRGCITVYQGESRPLKDRQVERANVQVSSIPIEPAIMNTSCLPAPAIVLSSSSTSDEGRATANYMRTLRIDCKVF
jgi:hypothetical protein